MNAYVLEVLVRDRQQRLVHEAEYQRLWRRWRSARHDRAPEDAGAQISGLTRVERASSESGSPHRSAA